MLCKMMMSLTSYKLTARMDVDLSLYKITRAYGETIVEM